MGPGDRRAPQGRPRCVDTAYDRITSQSRKTAVAGSSPRTRSFLAATTGECFEAVSYLDGRRLARRGGRWARRGPRNDRRGGDVFACGLFEMGGRLRERDRGGDE